MPEAGDRPAAAVPPAERQYWVAFSHIPGIGPARFTALLEAFGSAEAAWQAPASRLGQVLGPHSVAVIETTRPRLTPERCVAALERRQIQALTWADPEYPGRLRQISLPPFVLYVQGQAKLLSAPSVAVVGTRRPTEYGLRAAQQLARDLVEAGVVVVSGLARGIDAAAHQAALERGATIAVLGTGLDVAYPAAHRPLQRQIATRGALATELPPGSSAEPGNFPARNRIVSGLTMATVVVEAGEHSGALITARLAADEGREVLAVPGSIFSAASRGTHALLADGASLCREVGDILAAIGLAGRPVRHDNSAPDDPASAALVAALTDGPAHIDELTRRTGLAASEAARALALLEIAGQVRDLGGMRWTLR